MHIGLFSAVWPTPGSASGIVTYTLELKAGLEAIGHRVSIVTVDDSPPASLAARAVAAIRKRFSRPDDIACFPAVGRAVAATFARRHAADRFDIVEMEESFGWSTFVQEALDIPVVTRLHGPHFLGKDRFESAEMAARSARREQAEALAIATTRGITSPSERLLRATLDHLQIDRPKARAIYNPLALADEQDRWRADESEPGLVLCVGRFDWRKGADLVVRAFAEMAASRPAARLLLVGPDNGLQLEPGSFVNFADYVSRFPGDIVSRIEFLGKQSQAEIRALRRRASVTVVGSRFETFSYAAAEAMAAGCPLIGTDIFGVGEIITDGDSGWIVPSEDAGALASALGEALDNAGERARRGARAREEARRLFDPIAIANQTVACYDQLIG